MKDSSGLRALLFGSALRRNTAMTLGRQMIAAVAQLLTVILIARVLGPQGNGLYAMAILLPSLLVNFFNLGVGPATVYYVGRGSVTGGRAVGENLFLAGSISTIGIVFSLPVLALWGDKIFPGIPFELLVLGLAVFPISLLLAYWTTILQGLEDFRAFNWVGLAPPGATLLLTAIALLVLGQGVLGALLAYIAGQAVGLLVVWVFLRKLRNVSPTTGFPRYKRTLLGYGWKAHLSNIMAFVNYRADIFLVNFFLTPVATGVYVIAVQIAERLWMLSHAASAVLLPRLSAMHRDPVGRHAVTVRVGAVVGAITLAAALALAFALYFLLVPVFGSDYADALEPFLWLLPGVVAGAFARVYSNCIAASGKPEWNLYVSVFVVGTNVVGNLVLIPRMGLVGAAIATTVAYGLNAVIKLVLIRWTLTEDKDGGGHESDGRDGERLSSPSRLAKKSIRKSITDAS